MTTINTIIEKIKELRKDYVLVEFESEKFDPELVNNVHLTFSDKEGENAIKELLAELEELCDEYETHPGIYGNFTEFWFDCKDGEYEVDIWLVDETED